jgi:N-acylneuraminate cytidylyltransferase
MEILAIIPARGGSKSIPKKNIQPLLGKPLIAWVIAAARSSRYITRSIVSTDDEEIAAVARSFGAEVPFMRPVEISGDFSTDIEFLIHALDWLKAHEGYEPEIVLRLPPTSPLCTGEHIDQGIDKLLHTPEADAVRPITAVSKHPYKMWKISLDGRWLEPLLSAEITGFARAHDLPRQLFPKVYIHTGAMDVMRLRTIRELKSTSGIKLAYFFMDNRESINIDDQIDFDMAEFFMRRRLAGQEASSSARTL